jgi:hypothetical protein
MLSALFSLLRRVISPRREPPGDVFVKCSCGAFHPLGGTPRRLPDGRVYFCDVVPD